MTADTVPLWFVIFLAVEICVFVPTGTIWYCERLNAWFAERQTKKLHAAVKEEIAEIERAWNNDEYERRILEAIAQHWESTRTTRTPKRIH